MSSPRQRRPSFVGSVLVLTLLAACGGGGDDGGGLRPPAAVGSLTVVNQTTYTISQVVSSAPGASAWGANLLASPIAAGGSGTIPDIAAGTYDFKAVASDGVTAWQTSSATITAGGVFTWTCQPSAPEGSLRLVNGTTFTIAQLFVSPASQATWGSNQLPAAVPPGGAFTVTDIAVGIYDLKAVASDGTTYWQRDGVAITNGGLVTWTLLPASNGQVRVANNHCNPITELYVSPASSGSWGPDLLAGSIPNGGTFTVTDVPAGSYDLKAVAADGVYWTRFGVAVASGGTFEWTLLMPAGTGCLRVVNSSSYTVGYLYTPLSSNGCTYGSWGSDQLGTATIPVGASFMLSNVGAGYRDLRAVALSSSASWRACSQYVTAGQIFTWTLTN